MGGPEECDVDDEGGKGESARRRGENGDTNTLSLRISRVAGSGAEQEQGLHTGTDSNLNSNSNSSSNLNSNLNSIDVRSDKNSENLTKGEGSEMLRHKESEGDGREKGKGQGQGQGQGGKEDHNGVPSTPIMSSVNGDTSMDVVDDNHSSHVNGGDDRAGGGGGVKDKVGECEKDKENEREKEKEKEKGVWVVEADQLEAGKAVTHDTRQKEGNVELTKLYNSPADIMKRIGEEIIDHNSKLNNGHEISMMASRLPPLDPLRSGRDDSFTGWKRNINSTACIKSAFKKIKIRKFLPTGKMGSIFGTEY